MSDKYNNIPKAVIELFTDELETNSVLLEKGLVDLENNQRKENLEPLMRAAHSIKGASRIVNIEESIELAHTMEDVFTSCLEDNLHLDSGNIDVLLIASDIYSAAGNVLPEDIHDWFKSQSQKIDSIKNQLQQIITKGNIPQEKDKQSHESKSSETDIIPNVPALENRNSAQVKHSHSEQTAVKVQTEKMNRILGFAGESLIQSKSISKMFTPVKRMKILLREINHQLIRKNTTNIEMGSADNDRIKEIFSELKTLIIEHSESLENLSIKFEALSEKLYYETISTRMKRFSNGAESFPRMVRDVSKSLHKKINFIIAGEDTQVDTEILVKLESPLNHLIRNAVDHGIELPSERMKTGKSEEGTIILEARHKSGLLVISVSDDGRGISADDIRRKIVDKKLADRNLADKMSDSELMEFLFLPGFTTTDKVTEISGRGVGLDIVFSMVQDVGGTIRAESHPGKGSKFILQLPITLSLIRALIVLIADELYAIPLTKIDKVLKINIEEIEEIDGGLFVNDNNENIGLFEAKNILKLDSKKDEKQTVLSIVIVNDRQSRIGVIIDDFVSEENLVVKKLDNKLGKIPNISSGALLDDGSIVLILDVSDIIKNTKRALSIGENTSQVEKLEDKRKRILIVDDSPTIRESLRMILNKSGYHVFQAEDGIEALNILDEKVIDLIITDIDMPRMNGIELTRKIKSISRTAGTPVIVQSFKDREEDRDAAANAGAEMFLSKSSFDEEELTTIINMLII